LKFGNIRSLSWLRSLELLLLRLCLLVNLELLLLLRLWLRLLLLLLLGLSLNHLCLSYCISLLLRWWTLLSLKVLLLLLLWRCLGLSWSKLLRILTVESSLVHVWCNRFVWTFHLLCHLLELLLLLDVKQLANAM
jgi:hypothetical protein